MKKDWKKLYFIIISFCFFGYTWLFYNILGAKTLIQIEGICLFKKITNIPCPSCGVTRSIIFIYEGNFYKALIINPLGYLIGITMIVLPIWAIIDLIFKKRSLIIFLEKTISKIRGYKIFIPLIFIIILNWIWNILKGV